MFLARRLLYLVHSSYNKLCTSTMELYFKDLEAESAATNAALECFGNQRAEERGNSAEDIAFAELADEFAARLVY